MLIVDPSYRARGSFRTSVFMLLITALALILGERVLEVVALTINSVCWYLMASGARRDLKQIRMSTGGLSVTPPRHTKREHTGMYRGGF